MECGHPIGRIRRLRIRIDGEDGWFSETVEVFNHFESVTFETMTDVDTYRTHNYDYTSINSL